VKLDNLFKQARVVAENSHDSQTQVGSLLVNEETGAVIASGYNGFIRGACDDNLPTTRPDKHSYVLHSELNLIINCSLHGIQTKGCFVVCTLSPCIHCCRILWQAGIRTIYFQDKYRDFDHQISMKDLQINLQKVGKYYRIDLEAK
jgi:dCMP deaminase